MQKYESQVPFGLCHSGGPFCGSVPLGIPVQGQERDLILISLVRSNDSGQIGFLSDLRRMNVAMTRARMKLIIFGDKHTLCHHPFYRQLIKYVEELEQ